jgi:hypothetical protein
VNSVALEAQEMLDHTRELLAECSPAESKRLGQLECSAELGAIACALACRTAVLRAGVNFVSARHFM